MTSTCLWYNLCDITDISHWGIVNIGLLLRAFRYVDMALVTCWDSKWASGLWRKWTDMTLKRINTVVGAKQAFGRVFYQQLLNCWDFLHRATGSRLIKNLVSCNCVKRNVYPLGRDRLEKPQKGGSHFNNCWSPATLFEPWFECAMGWLR